MRVGLFIPCYIDQFYPQVGIATLQLLQKLGCEVHYPENQTCCGQPFSNSGLHKDTRQIQELFADNFNGYDYIVAPSGSCILHVKERFDAIDNEDARYLREQSFELVEFIHDVLGESVEARFPHKVGIHSSCHGLRGLRLGSGSERIVDPYDKVKALLSKVEGIEIRDLNHPDECCGFGGTFSIKEEKLSAKMGIDRLDDHSSNNVEVVTATDMSCLMHLEGLARRNKSKLRFNHVAEILNSD